MEPDRIVITGARQHNLKNVTVEIPKKKLVVLTGVSGSGKSSLAFDTLYAEGQRRYIESLSAYARQFLGQMEKPLYDSIKGLAPTISIEQKSASTNPRSTVGTVTEIHDYLRVLWARVGRLTCRNCGRPVSQQSAQQIVHEVAGARRGHEVPRPRPAREGAEGRAPGRARAGAQVRLRPRARRRHRAPPRRGDPPRQEEEALDRRGRRPARREAGHRAAPHGLRRDGAAPRPGHRRRRRRGRAGDGPLRAPGVPPLRHLVPRADAAAVLLQLAPGHVPGVLRPRHPHGDGPGARGAEPRPLGERGRGQAARRRGRGQHLGQRHRARGRPRARHRPQPALADAAGGAPAGHPLRHRRASASRSSTTARWARAPSACATRAPSTR